MISVAHLNQGSNPETCRDRSLISIEFPNAVSVLKPLLHRKAADFDEGYVMSLRIAMVSTYPPTQCGIATFARSLASAMSRLGDDVRILKLVDDELPRESPELLGHHGGSSDLIRSRHLLNTNDLVIVQHEFGIYGGDDGEEVLDIVAGLQVPVITIFHTVTATPTSRQRRIMQGLINASDALVVLSNSARRLLIKTYDVNPSRLHAIPHGAPRFPEAQKDLGASQRPVMMTWGLIGPGKGLEWGIAALANLRDLDLTPDYFIVGATHPKVQAKDGSAYRKSLEQLAADLRVQDRVHFLDEYLDSATLVSTVAAADIFLLPYDTRDQVVSGVLAEAMVAGGPIVATRFPHAVELLEDGTGLLVNQGDPLGISEAIRRIIRNPDERATMRRRTQIKGDSYLWPTVGAAFATLVTEVIADRWGPSTTQRVSAVPA